MNKRGKEIFNKRTLSNLIVVVLGVLFFLFLNNYPSVKIWFNKYIKIFKPFIVGIGFAYLLNMPMKFFESKVFKNKKHKRTFSILSTYLLFIIFIVVLLWLVIPQLSMSVGTLINLVSYYVKDLDGTIEDVANMLRIPPESLSFISDGVEDIMNMVLGLFKDFIPRIADFVINVGSSIISIVTAMIASIYMLAGKEKLIKQIKKIMYAFLPEKAGDEIIRIGVKSNQVFSGFISGKLLDSAIIGVICFVFMLVLVFLGLVTVPIATLVSVIIGVSNIIPFFGPFIGAVPSTIIILMFNPWASFIFVIFVVLLQQFDGNILGPKILGDSTGLPALWVLIAIIVGGGLFGFIGMILGVPTTAVLYSVGGDMVKRRLEKKNIDDSSSKFDELGVKKEKKQKHKKGTKEIEQPTNNKKS